MDQQWLNLAGSSGDILDEDDSTFSPFSSEFSNEYSPYQFVYAEEQPTFTDGRLEMMNLGAPVSQNDIQNFSFASPSIIAAPFVASPISPIMLQPRDWNIPVMGSVSIAQTGTIRLTLGYRRALEEPWIYLKPERIPALVAAYRRGVVKTYADISLKLMRNRVAERRSQVGIVVGVRSSTAALASRTTNDISRLASH
ncbi:hypothetical protein PG985_007618 [Apiospora marii]|uniref:uncharacterized protein n=1 Tax=Apiospora marii TaxID=335849 RepID=UPI003131C9B3